MISLKFIQKGRYCEISALQKGKSCEACDFIDKLELSDVKTHRRLIALLDRIAESGPPHNITQFRMVRNNLYEIKPGGIRLFLLLSSNSAKIDNTYSWLGKGREKRTDKTN